jgi:hypothetical protein
VWDAVPGTQCRTWERAGRGDRTPDIQCGKRPEYGVATTVWDRCRRSEGAAVSADTAASAVPGTTETVDATGLRKSDAARRRYRRCRDGPQLDDEGPNGASRRRNGPKAGRRGTAAPPEYLRAATCSFGRRESAGDETLGHPERISYERRFDQIAATA